MKQVPDLKTNAEAEAFLEQDLSDLDFGEFEPMRFGIGRRTPLCICEYRPPFWTS
jgi:predicted DNA binding CopG/RHH family protein